MIWTLTTTAAPAERMFVGPQATLIISGTWTGVVTIKLLLSDGTWQALEPTFTTNTVQAMRLESNGWVQPVFTTATSGTVTVEIRG